MAQQNAAEINALADILEGIAPAPEAVVTPPQPEPVPVPEVVPPVAPPATPEKPKEPTTPVNTPPPTQPQFNFDDELVKITNGTIKTKDDIAALIERSNKATELENQLKTFEEENTSLKAKVSIDPFANDYTKRLNELYKAGANDSQIQAFTALNKVADLEGLSPVEAKLLTLQIREGLTADEAKNYVNATYKLNPDEYDEDVIRQENIRLKVDSRADKEFLKGHKAEVSKIPESQQEQQQRQAQQEQEAHIAKIQPLAKNVINEAKSFFKGLSLNGKEGDQNVTADFAVSDESLKNMEASVQQFIQNSGINIPANEQGVSQIKDFASNVLAIQNYKNWIINAASTREMQVRAEYNNPSPINRGQDAPDRGKSTKEDFDKKLLEMYQ